MTDPNPTPSRRDVILRFAGAGGLAAVGWGYWRSRTRRTAGRDRKARFIETVITPHLTRVQRDIELAIESEGSPIDRLYADAKRNSPRFAEEALGWGSQRRWIQDSIPFGDRNRHSEFLRGKFEEHYFGEHALDDAVRQVVKSFLGRVQSLESRMLVDLRIDAADLAGGTPMAKLDDGTLRVRFEAGIGQLHQVTLGRLPQEIVRDIEVLLATEVLTGVALRLGVRAGLLGAGAASGVATLGIGTLISLILDQIVQWVWDGFADPRGQLVHEIDAKLEEMRWLMIEQIRDRLRRYARDRAVLRQQTVRQLFRVEEAAP